MYVKPWWCFLALTGTPLWDLEAVVLAEVWLNSGRRKSFALRSKKYVSGVMPLVEPWWLAGYPSWILHALALPPSWLYSLQTGHPSSGQGGTTGPFYFQLKQVLSGYDCFGKDSAQQSLRLSVADSSSHCSNRRRLSTQFAPIRHRQIEWRRPTYQRLMPPLV